MRISFEHKLKGGFTLVELLVVIAIISLLTTIAVVNLQTAQARSKVARVQADMRTIAYALELYQVDHGVYPMAAIGDIQRERPLVDLTTPVAYLGVPPRDPFGVAPFDFNSQMWLVGYQYKDRKTTSVGMSAETYGHIWEALPRQEYFINSPGPNRVWDVMPYREYDPTNGTISLGDISRFGP